MSLAALLHAHSVGGRAARSHLVFGEDVRGGEVHREGIPMRLHSTVWHGGRFRTMDTAVETGAFTLRGVAVGGGLDGRATALANRLPEVGLFELLLEQQDGRDRFQFGREADGSPSRLSGWDDLN